MQLVIAEKPSVAASIPDSRKRDDEFSPHLAEPPGFY